MMSKPENNDQPEWEQILRSLEQGYEVTEDRLNELTVDERAYISEITAKHKLKEAVASLESIDLKADWGLVSSRLDEGSVNKRTVLLFSKWARYAAILFLPVALTVGIYLTSSDKQAKQEQLARKHENRGANKVRLILGDGREIVLAGQQSIKTSDGTQIQTDADQGLVYKTEKNERKSAIFNTLVIPKGADYKLILDDLTEIWLNSDSRITFQVNFNATKTREVYLEKGEAYFKVAKNPEKPFIVRSSLMSLQVLGTSFNMNTYSREVQTTLVEGKVKLESFGSKEQILLSPGQQASFDKHSGSLKKQDVDVFPFVAWKDGIIVFQNVTMGELMEQLGRLYDYEIEFKDQSLKKLHYTGRADKSESIQNILAIIQETANLKFMIKERRITVGKQ